MSITPAPLQHATTCCAHTDMRAAVRLVAETYYGNYGIWLCDAFEAINAEWFSGNLPYPHIVINITAHGRCLGPEQATRRAWFVEKIGAGTSS